jgi:spore photoproduct lyase
MSEQIRAILKKEFGFSPNKNQTKDLGRLIFEIARRDNAPLGEIIAYLKRNAALEKYAGRNKFFGLKNALVRLRFPLTSTREKIDTKEIFLNQPPQDSRPTPKSQDIWRAQKLFKPLQILVEKEVAHSWLVRDFRRRYPKVPLVLINRYSEYLKENPFSLNQLKMPLVFIVKEKWDFIKPCPCTKYHLRCGYWIFNLGFGCPFDCSYCFLQQYANFPGIILPANLDDFFRKFDRFEKTLTAPIRIGTGEFCDSLALDDITRYSVKLIEYFATKKVIFELKTKSAAIDNLMEIAPAQNTVISWSLNPSSIIENEEIASASLDERLNAARRLQESGYRVAFHFDPIIHSPDWKKLYRGLVDELYSKLYPPFSWISLGTLRCNRRLKAVVEARFPQSNIFYGELFLGEDKKLRYPRFLREEIYRQMVAWIRKHDLRTPVYLCMEDSAMWEILGNFTATKDIEKYLLGI